MKTLLLTILAILTAELLLAQPTPEWTSSIGANLIGTPKIKFDNSGDLIAVGTIGNDATGKDISIIKYSPSGSIIWQHLFNGVSNGDDLANDFEIDIQNNIIITGSSAINPENADLIAIRYYADGTFHWLNSFDGVLNKEDAGKAISIDQTGASYVTGFTTTDSLEFEFIQRIVTTKIDSLGNTVWTRFFGTDTLAQYNGEKIKIINNEIRILASYQSENPFFVVLKYDTSGTLLFSNEVPVARPVGCFYLDDFNNSYLGFGGWERFKIIKANSIGNIVWSKTIPTNMPSNWTGDEARAIIVDSLQNVYVTGRHYGDDFNGPTYSNADIMTVKYNSGGSQLWSKRYEYLGNNAADITNTITLDKNLNVYVAGESQKTVAGTNYDYIVVKYSNNGNEIGTIRYNDTTNGNAFITSIIVDDSSNIYVTGSVSSSITTQKYSSVSGVGIFELNDKQISINAFPNPFTNITSIYFPNSDNATFDFQLSDFSGKIILKQKTKSDKIEVSADLTPGLYMFTLFSDKRGYNGKIIKTE